MSMKRQPNNTYMTRFTFRIYIPSPIPQGVALGYGDYGLWPNRELACCGSFLCEPRQGFAVEFDAQAGPIRDRQQTFVVEFQRLREQAVDVRCRR
jgi:hypothetical protein